LAKYDFVSIPSLITKGTGDWKDPLGVPIGKKTI
jgi:hypothetical protein